MLFLTICWINTHFTCKPRNHYLFVPIYTHVISTHIHHAPRSHTTFPSRSSPLSITPFISPSLPLSLPHPHPTIRLHQRILSHNVVTAMLYKHTTHHVPHMRVHTSATIYTYRLFCLRKCCIQQALKSKYRRLGRSVPGRAGGRREHKPQHGRRSLRKPRH